MAASDCVKREHGNYELDRCGYFLTSSASHSSLSNGVFGFHSLFPKLFNSIS